MGFGEGKGKRGGAPPFFRKFPFPLPNLHLPPQLQSLRAETGGFIVAGWRRPAGRSRDVVKHSTGKAGCRASPQRGERPQNIEGYLMKTAQEIRAMMRGGNATIRYVAPVPFGGRCGSDGRIRLRLGGCGHGTRRVHAGHPAGRVPRHRAGRLHAFRAHRAGGTAAHQGRAGLRRAGARLPHDRIPRAA